MLYKVAAILYVVLHMGIALGLRPWLLFKHTGINAYKKLGQHGVQGFNEKVMFVGALLVPCIVLFYLLPPATYAFLVPIPYLELEPVKYLGMGLMLLGALLGIVAQFQMGNAWRLGVDPQEKTTLVTSKLYKYSRNPIYLGLLVSFLGFFLLLPNALSLCCLVLSYPSFEVKIRIEEQYLLDKHGKAYQAYRLKVNRWF